MTQHLFESVVIMNTYPNVIGLNEGLPPMIGVLADTASAHTPKNNPNADEGYFSAPRWRNVLLGYELGYRIIHPNALPEKLNDIMPLLSGVLLTGSDSNV